MCGRYALITPEEALTAAFDLLNSIAWRARYNIAPTQNAPVIRVSKSQGGRVAEPARWGLVPFWADDESIGNRMINARSETAATKPAYRAAMKKRRCLVPASGFYEWQKKPRGKQPVYIHPDSDAPIAFAGLYERWTSPDGSELQTYTILTTDAGKRVKHIHNRMPVILDPQRYDHWLDPDIEDADRLADLLKPNDLDGWELRDVSRRVNSPKNDDPSLIEPAEADSEPDHDPPDRRKKKQDDPDTLWS